MNSQTLTVGQAARTIRGIPDVFAVYLRPLDCLRSRLSLKAISRNSKALRSDSASSSPARLMRALTSDLLVLVCNIWHSCQRHGTLTMGMKPHLGHAPRPAVDRKAWRGTTKTQLRVATFLLKKEPLSSLTVTLCQTAKRGRLAQSGSWKARDLAPSRKRQRCQ